MKVLLKLKSVALTLIILFSMNKQHFAVDKEFPSRISYTQYGGVTVSIGNPEATSMVAVLSGIGMYNDLNVRNFISLGVDHDVEQYHGTSFDLEVDILVTPSNNGNTLPSFTKTLTIGYHPFDEEFYRDFDVYRFTGADEFEYTITGIRRITGSVIVPINDLPNNIFIDGTIVVDRVADFTSESSTPITLNEPVLLDLDCDASTPPSELRISWNTIPTAVEYQLEWTFVNNYDGTVTGGTFGALPNSDLEYDFRHNSTRITTSNTYYDVPLIFESGYILWRIRAVGVNPLKQNIIGIWTESSNSGSIDDFITNNAWGFLINAQPHEVNKNWQLTTTFAEEGKKKEVISYYDGSLRNRQSVTVMNTDDNVIVGETIYDHQGRPAINVLPVPVIRPSGCTNANGENPKAEIKYYPQFNQTTGGVEYSRVDFDLDNGNCESSTNPMENNSGAANYYSEQNPNKADHQAYVPDANGYPFTQVEYTPDNTGRIRRQSGVGETFQLDSEHESKYYYGKALQLNLDRLFASEVGNAAHYKKNLVVDPNGQASISYLDQEGRVVATALAGQAPENLTKLTSFENLEAGSGVDLEVDLFEEDANGVSTNNTPNVTGDGIEFSAELLVSSVGLYEFAYDFNVDAYSEACTPSLCFNCVYDFKLAITDECSNVVLDNITGNPVEYEVLEGYFTLDSDGKTVFTSSCQNGGNYDSDGFTFQANLSVGNYTVVKKLTINNDAISHAFADYIEEGQLSGCIDDLQDFIDAEMAQIDTSGCDISCATCLNNLGTLDDFLAQQSGTVEDYEALKEECDLLCNEPTFCETMFELMSSDMAPGGQYGEYLVNGNNGASAYPLSVYNPTNILPQNSFGNTTAGTPNWREPKYEEDGLVYDYYLDEFGDSAKVFLTVMGTGANMTVSPNVIVIDGTANDDVHFDPTIGLYYTYPHRMLNTYEFIAEFEYSWAKSLVYYHPEYCYYETCISYGEEDVSGNSSDDFDKLMLSSLTFQDAINNGLLEQNGGFGPYTVIDYSLTSSSVYDPFITSGNYSGFGAALGFSLNNYETISSGVTLTMQEFAAMTARCGGNLSSGNLTILQNCASLWGDYNGTANPIITNDDEWIVFRSLYLGKKQELQRDFEDFKALNSGNGSESCLNDCIGNDNFSPLASGMWNGSSFGSNSSNPYYNSSNPCSFAQRFYYQSKTKRFPDREDLEAQANNTNPAYQSYLQTGQCPNAIAFQNFLNEIAQDQQLTASSNILNGYTSFSVLYGSVYNNNVATPNSEWNTSSVSNALDVQLLIDGNNCVLKLDGNGATFNWNDITGFSGLTATASSGGDYEFTVNASFSNGTVETLVGTTCIPLDGCTFESVCEPNDLGLSVEETLSFIAQEGQLLNPNYALSSSTTNPNPYGISVSVQLLNLLGASSAADLTWQFSGTNNIAKIINGAEELRLVFNSSTPSGFNGWSSVAYFEDLTSAHQHYFTVNAFDINGNLLANLEGEAVYTNDGGVTFTGVPFGECGLPDPIACSEDEHQALEDLKALLNDVLITENYNIYQSSELTNLLAGYLGNSTQSAGTISTSTDQNTNVTTDVLEISVKNDDGDENCLIELSYEDPINFNFPHITSIDNFTAVGVLQTSSFNDFEFEASFDDGNGNTQIITVSGSSCLPLKNCDQCVTDLVVTPDLDSIIIQEGRARMINPDDMITLQSAIDNLNAREGFTAGSAQYVQSPSMKEYMSKNLDYALDYYIHFINNYDANLDDSCYLYNMQKFYADYGYAFDVNREYDRYEEAVNQYNDRATAIQQATIAPMTRDDFADEKLACHAKDYVNYVKTEPTTSSSAVDAVTFFTNSGVINNNPASSCEVLYDNYKNAYYNFFDNTTLTNDDLKICQTVTRLVSIEDFEKNNLCCSQEGIDLLNEYINAFSNLGECPPAFPSLDDCGDPDVDLGKECNKLYSVYIEFINKYNESPYALANNYFLTPASTGTFLASGYCECVEQYLKYLSEYIDAQSITTLPLPADITTFADCNQPEDVCVELFDEYNETTAAYAQFIIDNNLPWPRPRLKFSYEEFNFQGLCNCAESYIAYLNALMDGIITEVPTQEDIDHIEMYCDQAPCVPDANFDLDTVTPITIEYINPCVEQAINIAELNAAISYQEYINSLATTFVQNMKSHCLGADEEFSVNYTDYEYHYTLYYYDQAGNLVRTVPPEGVEIVPTISSYDAVSQSIITDRTNNVQTVFTKHRLATKYKYNSLNQLTHQSLPDHDLMNVFDLSLTDGLNQKLRVESIHFVSEQKGFLAGFIRQSGKRRGILYTTDDGGLTWQKVNHTLGSNLQSVQWINNSQNAYAVGSAGTLIKTSDNGLNWDMIDTYDQNVKAQLNDLHLDNSGNGLIVGNNGTILSLNNDVVTAIVPLVTNNTNFAINSDDNITAIHKIGNDYYITVDFTNANGDKHGAIYRSVNGSAWEVLDRVRLESITAIQTIDADNYVAVSDKGVFVKSFDGGENWYVMEVDTKTNFRDIYFSSVNDGIALKGSGDLYQTQDGGVTWQPIFSSEQYSGIYAYQNDKVLAYGNNGAVARIILTSGTFGIIEHTSNLTGNLVTGWAGELNGNPVILVSTGNGIIKYCTNANAISLNWFTMSSGTSTVKQIEAAVFGNVVRGIVKDDNDLIYGFDLSGVLFSSGSIPSNPSQYKALGKNLANDEFILYDNTSGDVYTTSASSGAPSSVGTLIGNIVSTEDLNYVSVEASANTLIVAGEKGAIYTGTNAGGSYTFEEQTHHIRPLALKDATEVGTDLISIGNNGDILATDINATPPSSTLKSTGSVADLNAIDQTGTEAIIVGNNGTVMKINSSTNETIIPVTAPVNLTAVAVDPNSNTAYAGDENGSLYRTADITQPIPQFVSTPANATQAVNAIDVSNSGMPGTVFYVGDNAQIYQGALSLAYEVKNIYTPKLNDVHFNTVTNGYVVGDNHTIRHTSDGGNSWTTVLPTEPFVSGDIPNLNAVFTLNNNEAQIVGQTKYITRANNITTTETPAGNLPSGGNYALRDIKFSDANNGAAVGGPAGSGRVWLTNDGGNSWNAITNANLPGGTKGLNGVHAFNDNTYAAVGNDATIILIQSANSVVDISPAAATTTETLYDVYFDSKNTGYAVGEDGTLIRSTVVSTNGAGTVTGVNWESKPTADLINTNAKDIKAIGFATPYQGVIGGRYTSGGVNITNYARLIRDDGSQFSTYFWYDRLGRIVASQNSKQFNTGQADKRYSYTLYDELGRVVEAGEKVENQTAGNQFKDIFGTYVSGLYNPSVIDDGKLNSWINDASGTRQEVTRSFYDLTIAELGITGPTGFTQTKSNMRKRISAVTYEKVYDYGAGNEDTYSYGTFYEYDIHGNVETLIQDNKELASNSNPDIQALQYKTVDYTYDLISGNVHQVSYQDGKADQWHHRYTYDGDNRIKTAETSIDKFTWDRDANYIYYDHGPLARVEIGEHNVQGSDYVYTLQGWLKGVNSDLLNPNNDVGKDGVANGTHANAKFARDAMGFSLSYYENDYSPIDYVNIWQNEATRFVSVFNPAATAGVSDVKDNREDLYNGNIGSMVTTLTEPTLYAAAGGITPNLLPQATSYRYDQLNRIDQARAFQNVEMDITDPSYNTWAATGNYDNLYYNEFEYDASGNITHQKRHDETGALIEDLVYHYGTDGLGKLLKNRLYHVNDNATATNEALHGDDIEDMGAFESDLALINNGKYTTATQGNNYRYDAIGQLLEDHQEEIYEIRWRVDNKVAAIIRAPGSEMKNITFDYDPMGNRIAKHIYSNASFPATGTAVFDPDNPIDWEKTTYYNRDAQGNVLATYDYIVDAANNSSKFTLIEKNIYGSSRIGMDRNCVEMIGAINSTNPKPHNIGLKQYECANHLGNVLAVVTDRKHPIDDDGDGMIDYYQPEIVKATDYSPFGVELYERNFVREEVIVISTDQIETVIAEDDFTLTANGGTYNVGDQATGWNHILGTGEVTSMEEYFINSETFGFFISSQWLIAQKDWSNTLTVGDDYTISFDITSINGAVFMLGPQGITNTYTTIGTKTISFNAIGTNGSFSLWSLFGGLPTDVTIDNLKLTKTETITETCTVPVGSYRYGFNGMEKDNEVKGQGNSYDFGARIYDSRLGRWLSIDPKFGGFPKLSPYSGNGNNPIMYIDVEGETIVDGQGREVKIVRNKKTGSLSFSGGKLSDKEKIILVSMSNTRIGRKVIRKMQKSTINVYPMASETVVVTPAKDINSIEGYGPIIKDAIKAGHFTETEIAEDKAYFKLYGLNYPTMINQDGQVTDMTSAVYLKNIQMDTDMQAVTDELKDGTIEVEVMDFKKQGEMADNINDYTAGEYLDASKPKGDLNVTAAFKDGTGKILTNTGGNQFNSVPTIDAAGQTQIHESAEAVGYSRNERHSRRIEKRFKKQLNKSYKKMEKKAKKM